MAKGPESRLQDKIRKGLAKEFAGSFWFKSHGGPMQRKGIPDLIGTVNGLFIGIEVKVPGKEDTVTKIQQATLDDITWSGGLAFMSTNLEHCILEIKRHLDKHYL
jgi:hypothetical protein